MLSKSRPIVVASMMLLIALALISITTTAQFGATPSQYYTTQVIMNLLNGQQYFGVPHVYQGVNNSVLPPNQWLKYYITNQWPMYYGPNNASQYWGSIGINQPVLELIPAQVWSSGAMFWQEEYYNGSLVRITIIGTYSEGPPLVGDGFVIYLFLTPTRWGINPAYNYTINCTSLISWGATQFILPQSNSTYAMVIWNPCWQISCFRPGTTGQWDVWIINNTNGNNPSFSAAWEGIGTGAFQPNPGDYIGVTVTYNSSANMLSGIAYDMSTGQSASFTLNLTDYYKPPSSGNYVFGVGAGNGWHYANWALLYVAMTISAPTSSVTTPTMSSTSTKPTPSAPSLSTILTWVVVVLIVVVVVLIIAAAILITVLRMIKRSER